VTLKGLLEAAMALFSFRRKDGGGAAPGLSSFLDGFSIEVMPRTAEKVEDFRALLPPGTRVYIAHIDGTPIEDMVATAARIAGEGFPVMPHFPARIIPDRATLGDWIARYQGRGRGDPGAPPRRRRGRAAGRLPLLHATH
jgi:methylenetetrahydrofolate reductase (NADPH)